MKIVRFATFILLITSLVFTAHDLGLYHFRALLADSELQGAYNAADLERLEWRMAHRDEIAAAKAKAKESTATLSILSSGSSSYVFTAPLSSVFSTATIGTTSSSIISSNGSSMSTGSIPLDPQRLPPISSLEDQARRIHGDGFKDGFKYADRVRWQIRANERKLGRRLTDEEIEAIYDTAYHDSDAFLPIPLSY